MMEKDYFKLLMHDSVVFSLDIAFDLSSSTKDGEISLRSIDSTLTDLIGITFSSNGSKLFAVHRGNTLTERVFEFSLRLCF